jgi:lactoylglutathione lyase
MYTKERVMQLVSVRLLVDNFPAEVAFWRDVMGLPVSFVDEAMGYAYFDTGATGLELFSRNEMAAALGEATPAPGVSGHQAVVTFKVDDVDTAYADFVKRGAASVVGPTDRPAWRVRAAHLSDPEGHLIEIYTSLATPAQ